MSLITLDKYKSYEDYLKHQSSKLDSISKSKIEDYNERFKNLLKERINNFNIKFNSVLCLAARTRC